MTTLTTRMIKGDFVVTGPDVEPMKFTSRRLKTGRGGVGSDELEPGRMLGRASCDAGSAFPVPGPPN
jgi:hypothetical protein